MSLVDSDEIWKSDKQETFNGQRYAIFSFETSTVGGRIILNLRGVATDVKHAESMIATLTRTDKIHLMHYVEVGTWFVLENELANKKYENTEQQEIVDGITKQIKDKKKAQQQCLEDRTEKIKDLVKNPMETSHILFERINSYHKTLESGLDEMKVYEKAFCDMKKVYFKEIHEKLTTLNIVST